MKRAVFLWAVLACAPAMAAEPALENFMRDNGIVSIESALDWESRNFRYQPHGDGPGWRWQSSVEALGSKRPNCQGYASLNFEVLERLGYQPAIYSFQVGMGRAATRHAAVVFRKGSRWAAVSNEDLLISEEKTLEAFFCWLGMTRDWHFPVLRRKAG